MTSLIRFAAPALALAALLAAPPAGAQTGNQTDIPPPAPPGGLGGSYLGPGPRFENEFLVRDGQRVLFRRASAGCVVRRTAQRWYDSTAHVRRTGAEYRVETLMTRASGGDAEVEALARILRAGAGPESPTGRAARELAESIDGLLLWRCECPPRREDYTEAEQWDRAIRAYSAYLAVAPDAVFSPPSPELRAVHDALSGVIGDALRGLRGGRA
jgi:hypothetical protein